MKLRKAHCSPPLVGEDNSMVVTAHLVPFPATRDLVAGNGISWETKPFHFLNTSDGKQILKKLKILKVKILTIFLWHEEFAPPQTIAEKQDLGENMGLAWKPGQPCTVQACKLRKCKWHQCFLYIDLRQQKRDQIKEWHCSTNLIQQHMKKYKHFLHKTLRRYEIKIFRSFHKLISH